MIPHLAEWLWFILGDFSAKSSFSGILMLLIICNLRKFSLTASIRERYLVMSVSNCIDHCLDFYRSLDWKLCFQTCMSVLRRVPHSLVPGPFPGEGEGEGMWNEEYPLPHRQDQDGTWDQDWVTLCPSPFTPDMTRHRQDMPRTVHLWRSRRRTFLSFLIFHAFPSSNW